MANQVRQEWYEVCHVIRGVIAANLKTEQEARNLVAHLVSSAGDKAKDLSVFLVLRERIL